MSSSEAEQVGPEAVAAHLHATSTWTHLNHGHPEPGIYVVRLQLITRSSRPPSLG